MPKIFILMACEECKWCVHIARTRWHCFNYEKEIPDIGEIADFCELDDWEKNKCLCPHDDNWDCQHYDEGKCEKEIPCNHVAPEGGHYCSKCGEFLGC